MKLFKSILILAIFCFNINTTVFANSIASNDINEFSNNTIIKGSLPVLTTDNASLTKQINTEIDNIYNTRSTYAKNSNAKSINFSYDIYKNDDVTSIVIYSNISKLKSITYVDTIVYDDDTILTLDNYLSSTDLKLFNKSINEKIKKSPENYTVSQISLNDKSNFYVKNDTVYAIFDGDSITSSSNISTFEYKSEKNDTYTLKKSNYYVQGNSQTKYVPIREVYSNLGYDVSYKNKAIYIYDSDEKEIVNFNVEQNVKPVLASSLYNSYSYSAIVKNGTSYTTLSVVEATTNVVYDIQPNGDIIFTLSN